MCINDENNVISDYFLPSLILLFLVLVLKVGLRRFSLGEFVGLKFLCNALVLSTRLEPVGKYPWYLVFSSVFKPDPVNNPD